MKHLLLCLTLCILSSPFIQAENISVASYLARRLVEIGSNKVFGVTGDYSYLFLHAVEANTNLTRIGNHNELEASYAAWAYSRAHPQGAPGVISTTYGGGSFNGLTGFVGADLDAVPMIYISGAPPRSAWQLLENFGIVQHHIAVDIPAERDVFAKFAVAADIIQNAQRAAYQIDSIILATLAYRRPVYLTVWTDVWTQMIPAPTTPLNPALAMPFVVNQTAVAASVAKTVAYLQSANFPCIFAGRELKAPGLQDLFEKLVNRTNLPYFTTPNAKGIISELNPKLVLNTVNSNIATSIDFLLEIGTHYGDYESRNIGFFAPNAGVTIKARKNSVTTSYRILYPNVPLSNYLQALYDALVHINYVNPHYNSATMRQTWPTPTRDDPDSGLTYNSFVNHLAYSGILTKDTVLTIDTTFVNTYIQNRIPVHRDGYLADNGLLTIGYTSGASLGIKEALPNKRVIVLVGDGAFQNVPMGLSTSQREGHDTIVFLFHNNVYCIEQIIEDKTPFFDHNVPFFPENLIADWNYTRLARAYGAQAHRVTTHRELTKAIRKALDNTDGTTLVEVVLPERDWPH